MDKKQFRQALVRNNVSVDDFAQLAGRTAQTVYEFGGKKLVPYYVRTLLRLLDERGGVHGLVPAKSIKEIPALPAKDGTSSTI